MFFRYCPFMKIQIIGLGNLGINLLKIIHQKKRLIKKLFGENIEITSISDSKGTLILDGISLINIVKLKKSDRLKDLDAFEKINALKAIEEIKADAVVELTLSTQTGFPGIEYAIKAFENNKDVITANKSILTSDKINIIKKANEMNRILKYDATVCGSIPVFSLLDYSLIPAKIIKIEGLFNATTTYIISRIENGLEKEKAISDAIKLGISEKNINDDLFGIDSARKGIILHRRIFNSDLSLKDVNIKIKNNYINIGHRQMTIINKDNVVVKNYNIKNKKIYNYYEGASMNIKFYTDLFDTLSLGVKFDGAYESASSVFNDILLTLKERKKF